MNKTVLQTQNLTKRYNGLTAVDDLSLEIYQGEIFGLLGPNGAGKTTSINMICGLLPPDAGQVRIQGRRVHGGDVSVRARVGVCPQEVILWEKLTCLEQLEFVGEMYGVRRKTARQRGQELLETLGLSEKRDRLASTLSGGMQRRLNLALALVHDPEILVLDEPEAGLDPQSRVLVREYVRSLARQKTILLTTHNMDEADRMADRVAIIDHGRLLVLDTPAALKRSIGAGDVLELEVKGISGEQALAVLEESLPKLTSLRVTPHRLGAAQPGRNTSYPGIANGACGVWQSPGWRGDRFVKGARDDMASSFLVTERSNLQLGEKEIASLPSEARNDVISVKGQNIVENLPAIITLIQKSGGQVGEVHLRANTLEDVFIALTGRRLRE